MKKQDLIKAAVDFIDQSPDNRIAEEIAISKDVVGLKIFDEPIFAFGSAADEYFQLLKQPGAIGEHHMLPRDWLPSAKTVISFFLPFTGDVRKSNGQNMTWPSDEWLHARIEGQVLLIKLCTYLKTELESRGYKSIIPAMDSRFMSNGNGPAHEEKFTSNWSERHAAFVCGHGTFGLSKGLITRKGIAGRFGSIITELYLEPDVRSYRDIYEYCTMCGKCAENCPVSAISTEKGKDHNICCDFLDETMVKCAPRYGCGKCQIHVPCESGIPKQR